jgi:hypothetical protein
MGAISAGDQTLLREHPLPWVVIDEGFFNSGCIRDVDGNLVLAGKQDDIKLLHFIVDAVNERYNV